MAENEETPRARVLLRRRRANVAGGRQHSHRVLVSPEEEARLVLRAAERGVSVPRLLIESALADEGETPTERRDAIIELFAIRRQVTGIATNVNQMAAVANTKAELPTQEQADAMFAEVYAIVRRLDDAVDGLGLS